MSAPENSANSEQKAREQREQYVRHWTDTEDNGDRDDAFSTVIGRRASKRQRSSTCSTGRYVTQQQVRQQQYAFNEISKDQFKSMNTDDKLNTLFDMMVHVTIMQPHLTALDQKVNTNSMCIDENSQRIKLLEYKSIDIEARSRRNNLVFRGLQERRNEDVSSTLQTFLCDKLGLEPDSFSFQRVHRVGRYSGNSYRPRPVIACMSDYGSVELILANAFKLRNTLFSINRDFPVEITAARSRLWPEYKSRRQADPAVPVKIVYPAKLIVNGRVVRDEFPDWDDVMTRHRDGPNTQRNPVVTNGTTNTTFTMAHDQDSSSDSERSSSPTGGGPLLETKTVFIILPLTMVEPLFLILQ